MLAPGDASILWALYTLRYARSGQLHRYLDRNGKSIRRRIHDCLAPEGLVISLRRRPVEEAAYALGPKGFDFIAAEFGIEATEIPYSRQVSQDVVESIFWRHTLAINDVRIAFEKAVDGHAALVLDQFVPEWHLADPRATQPEKKFALRERLASEGGVKPVSFRPDAMMLFYPRAMPGVPNTGAEHKVACFLELDRKSESIRPIIERKIEAYRRYWVKARMRRHGASWMKCLFVLDGVKSKRRSTNMQAELQRIAILLDPKNPTATGPQGVPAGPAAFVHAFLFCHADNLLASSNANPRGVVDDPIWEDWLGHPRAFFKPRTQES